SSVGGLLFSFPCACGNCCVAATLDVRASVTPSERSERVRASSASQGLHSLSCLMRRALLVGVRETAYACLTLGSIQIRVALRLGPPSHLFGRRFLLTIAGKNGF